MRTRAVKERIRKNAAATFEVLSAATQLLDTARGEAQAARGEAQEKIKSIKHEEVRAM
jgi:hypothetical protein